MKNKIFIFNEICPGGNYGIKTYIEQLSSCFHKMKDFEIHIVNLRSNANEFTLNHESNAIIYEIPREKYWKKSQDVYYRNVLFLLNPHITNCSENIFFQINYFEHKPLIDYLKIYFPKGKIVFTLHYLDWSFILQGNTSRFRRIINGKKENYSKNSAEYQVIHLFNRDKALFNSVDIIICLSKYAKSLLINNYEISDDKIELIYNGVSESIENKKSTKKALRRKYAFDQNEKLILYVGRLDRTKGGKELIQAFQFLLKKLPKSRLIVIGSGKENIYFEGSKGCWNKITFTGQIKREVVYEFYQMADVGVLPSFTEQCSYVVIEMMMHGLPVVGTTSTGLSEMILDGVNGYKVNIVEKDYDVEMNTLELADRIHEVLSANEESYATISLNCRKIYKEKYNITQIQDQLIKIFRKVLYRGRNATFFKLLKI